MIYQLPNGKVIEISTEQYFEMSDEEFEYLVAYNYGEIVENPWFGSVISKADNSKEDVTETVPDLTDIPLSEKLVNPDLDMQREEE
jgi:hypothetical protein